MADWVPSVVIVAVAIITEVAFEWRRYRKNRATKN